MTCSAVCTNIHSLVLLKCLVLNTPKGIGSLRPFWGSIFSPFLSLSLHYFYIYFPLPFMLWACWLLSNLAWCDVDWLDSLIPVIVQLPDHWGQVMVFKGTFWSLQSKLNIWSCIGGLKTSSWRICDSDSWYWAVVLGLCLCSLDNCVGDPLHLTEGHLCIIIIMYNSVSLLSLHDDCSVSNGQSVIMGYSICYSC